MPGIEASPCLLCELLCYVRSLLQSQHRVGSKTRWPMNTNWSSSRF